MAKCDCGSGSKQQFGTSCLAGSQQVLVYYPFCCKMKQAGGFFDKKKMLPLQLHRLPTRMKRPPVLFFRSPGPESPMQHDRLGDDNECLGVKLQNGVVELLLVFPFGQHFEDQTVAVAAAADPGSDAIPDVAQRVGHIAPGIIDDDLHRNIAERNPVFDPRAHQNAKAVAYGIHDQGQRLIDILQHDAESEHINRYFKHTEHRGQILLAFQRQDHAQRKERDVHDLDDENKNQYSEHRKHPLSILRLSL